MKVGTDGVLLGAWAPVEAARCILDIGTGSGLVALMAAQRNPTAEVLGIDVDVASVEQARENVNESPFVERVSVRLADVRDFALSPSVQGRFDAIVCNPPFYTEDTLPPESGRAVARNASSLPFSELVASVSQLLSEDGLFSVVLPSVASDMFTKECLLHGLHAVRLCRVKTVARKPPKRVLMVLSKSSRQDVVEEEIVLQEGNQRSKAYTDLCEAFYL